jgi:Sigma-70, region 4
LTTGGAPQDVLERRQTVRETLETLAALPERQREALLRTAIEGRSQADVARDLGLSDGAVRQLVHRARTAVRAAATALTPLPAANWLAAAGTRGEPMSERLAELVGAAGAGATLAKAGTIAVLAGGAAAGPALVERVEPRAPATAAAESVRPVREPARARDRAVPAPIEFRIPAPRTGSRGHGSDSSGPGSGRRDDRDSSGPGGAESSGPGSDGSGTSGSGSSGSGSGSSGSDSGSESSGSGSGTSGSSGSGSDSGSSGSGSGTSGSSGSGSGSGSSGSGTSGTSGSSGSGSDSGSSGSRSSGSGSETGVYATETSGSGSGSSGSSGSGSGSSSSGSDSGSSGSGAGESEPDEVETP